MSLTRCHDTILVSKVRSLQQTQSDSKSFRRTVAQALADGGAGGMELAQRLLGHTSMAMTVSACAKPIIPTIDPTAVTGAM